MQCWKTLTTQALKPRLEPQFLGGTEEQEEEGQILASCLTRKPCSYSVLAAYFGGRVVL